MTHWFSKVLDRLFVVLGALLFLQFPLFIYQYQNQLIGHVDELKRQVETMQRTAFSSGKSIDQYIQKFIDHADSDFSQQGAAMKETKLRWQKLSNALVKLQNASPLTKPWIFFSHLDWDIMLSSARNYEPGIPFSREGLCYAFLGMGAGALLFYLMNILWKRTIWRRKPEELSS